MEPLLNYGDLTIFQNGGRPPSWICFVHVSTIHDEYLVVCLTVQNFVLIGQNVAEILRFFRFFFQNGGRPPSWICYVHVWTINDEYFMAKFGWNRCSSVDNNMHDASVDI